MDPELRSARDRSRGNTRRARKRAAEVAGPIPATVYAAIRASGACVYCGDIAETVDHIVPLARGGLEHPDNLVPACGACNSSKNDRLLSEWDPNRVTHAVSASEKVAAIFAVPTKREERAMANQDDQTPPLEDYEKNKRGPAPTPGGQQ